VDTSAEIGATTLIGPAARPAHAAATRELAGVEEGTLTLTVAGRGYQVGPGMCARFPGGVPHGYANEGTSPLRLTMIVVVPPAPA